MRLRLIRHATLVLEYGGKRWLIDPMLDNAGARGAIENSPNPRRNPLVVLPDSAETVVNGSDAVLVTHTHSDHWDATAAQMIAKNITFFGQVEDEGTFRAANFSAVQVIERIRPTIWNGVRITRTGGQHGTGEIAKMLAPVSGYILETNGEPTLYIAGDTIWGEEVKQALQQFRPSIIVLNAGGARFLEGDPITMTPDDVVQVCRSAPDSQLITVHMEAINHCLVNRADLAFQLEAARVIQQVAIPGDGDWVDLRS
jgi:L-ascorbate metabolism protein UlaG (beta-lactamase superfamily)